MNRYEQRRQERLQNPEIVAGYREMTTELQLMQALEEIRKRRGIPKETIASHMGRRRESVSRLLNANDTNPTLNTLVELLSALDISADITLRQAEEGESTIHVTTQMV